MRATVKYVVVIKLECIHILPENITFFFFFGEGFNLNHTTDPV